MTCLVTGGAGFIGANFVLSERGRGEKIVNLDALTYSGNPANLEPLREDSDHVFVHGDIGDRALVRGLLETHHPDSVVNFAAESHVDRSIDSPDSFIQTNIVGTFHLLEEVRRYWGQLSGEAKDRFRFLHVSTDEVYGSLGPEDPPFHENTPYAPNSPYAASKASSDHLVRSSCHTYGLPTLITNCSNNYGPRQFPEKLLPLMILNLMEGKPLPIYGDGLNVRDWLYVEDHCEALRLVLHHGRTGETYNIGGTCERTNMELVEAVCAIFDEILPKPGGLSHAKSIIFVKDRPGHDRRYAIDCSKIKNELGWNPRETLATGLRKTVLWYLDNPEWVSSVRTGAYREWISRHYGG